MKALNSRTRSKTSFFWSPGLRGWLITLALVAVVSALPAWAWGNLWYWESKGPFKNLIQVVDLDLDGDAGNEKFELRIPNLGNYHHGGTESTEIFNLLPPLAVACLWGRRGGGIGVFTAKAQRGRSFLRFTGETQRAQRFHLTS
jgi:hypothetical protein